MYLRPATINDATQLLEWKNDSFTRRNAILTEAEILWPDHMNWLIEKLEDPECELYVITSGAIDYGDIRFDHLGKVTEVSIRIAPKYRGNGIASSIILAACKGRGDLIAKIVDGNVSSEMVFLNAGFKPKEHHSMNGKGFTIYERT